MQEKWCQSLQNNFWATDLFLVLAGFGGKLKRIIGCATGARVIFSVVMGLYLREEKKGMGKWLCIRNLNLYRGT